MESIHHLAAERGQDDRLHRACLRQVEHVAFVWRGVTGYQRGLKLRPVVERPREQDGVNGRATDIQAGDHAQDLDRPLRGR